MLTLLTMKTFWRLCFFTTCCLAFFEHFHRKQQYAMQFPTTYSQKLPNMIARLCTRLLGVYCWVRNKWFEKSLRFMSPEEKCHDQGMWKPNFRTIPAISKQSYNLLFGLTTVEYIQRCLIFGHASLVFVCKRSVRCCSAHSGNFTVCSNSWTGITKIWTMNRF